MLRSAVAPCILLFAGCGPDAGGEPAATSTPARSSAVPGDHDAAPAPPSASAVPVTRQADAPSRAWLRDTRERPADAADFAKGLRGPIDGAFRGRLICKVTVGGGDWDDPFLGGEAETPPDLLVIGPTRTVIFRDNRAVGHASFPAVEISAGSEVRLVVSDLDQAVNDDVGTLVLTNSGAFPMEGTAGKLSASCTGIPPEVNGKYLASRREIALAALDGVEASPPEVDLNALDASYAPMARVREAMRDWAFLVGAADPEVAAALERVDRAQVGWRTRVFSAIDREIESAPDVRAWREIAGIEVRATDKTDSFEVSPKKPVDFQWSKHMIGRVNLGFINRDGERVPTSFSSLHAGGAPLSPSAYTLKAGAVVELRMSPGVDRARYAVFSADRAKAVFFRCR
jgi:hypothetical protein